MPFLSFLLRLLFKQRYRANYSGPVTRIFQRGVTWTSDYKTRGVWGHAPPGNFQKLDALRLLLRPFWDRSRALVATWLAAILHPIFGCPCMHLFISTREGTYLGWQNSRWDDINWKDNSRAPELAIYLRTYLRASFHRCCVNIVRARSALILHARTRIAVTKLVWTLVILDRSETRGPLSNSRTLKMYS